MEKDKVLLGIGAGFILSGLAALDTFFTNRKLRKAAKAIGNVTSTISNTLDRCVVDVHRDGRRVSAVSMITPGLVSRNYRK